MVLDPRREDHGDGELLCDVMVPLDLILRFSFVRFSIASLLFFLSLNASFVVVALRLCLLRRMHCFSLDGLIQSKFLKSLLLIHGHPHDGGF